MSTNAKADLWVESYLVPWGRRPPGGTQTESLRDSLVSTNGNAVDAATNSAEAVRVLGELPKVIAKEIWDETEAVWENQTDAAGNPLPVGSGAMATMMGFAVATNGQTYRNAVTGKEAVGLLEEVLGLLRAIVTHLGIEVEDV